MNKEEFQVATNNAIIASSYAEEAPLPGSQRRLISQALWTLKEQRDKLSNENEELKKEVARLRDELDKQ